MIQTLGDVFMLVGIISVGVVAFLLVILLYHLVFVVMDLRKVMHRLNEITEQIEGMLLRPVELVSDVVEWLQTKVWDVYVGKNSGETRKERRAKKKHLKKQKKRGKIGAFERTEV